MAISTSKIEKLVDEPYFSRGKSYFLKGLVCITAIQEQGIVAKALGSRLYTISLYLKKASLDGNCTCPSFIENGPCKHMAAAGLAWQATRKGNYSPSPQMVEVMSELSRKRRLLAKKTKGELIEMLMDLSYTNPEIFDEFDAW